MQLQHFGNSQWKVILQQSELNTLIVAAKKLLSGPKGRIPKQAKNKLMEITNSYDAECQQLYEASKKKRNN
ncbi:hypothetical protein NC796_04715 [Aliifodinibius sp. S!AR15-10]|uniref:hypothetical protein n=1 Tax=Aliifodinibius sp. S!AR15-10 TaxID=2950437 RepID=UPI002854402B|nr:hypothetical protein [Aliifodinibius sp. S!AR15-10]MDR8390433.1 hypothetical protein [Aliifodinibius sp. S!AR15-10]